MSDDAGAIRITVNGNAATCPMDLTVEELLQHLGLPVGRVAVERNREIVRRDVRENVRVQPGDVFEVVTFVGGG